MKDPPEPYHSFARFASKRSKGVDYDMPLSNYLITRMPPFTPDNSCFAFDPVNAISTPSLTSPEMLFLNKSIPKECVFSMHHNV
jgi:hypothetical protein